MYVLLTALAILLHKLWHTTFYIAMRFMFWTNWQYLWNSLFLLCIYQPLQKHFNAGMYVYHVESLKTKIPTYPPKIIKQVRARANKTNKMILRPAKTQISLGIRPVWSESSHCAHWVAKDPGFLHADKEDSAQTGRMPRLIWVFAGRKGHVLVLSWGGPFINVALI